MTISRVKPSNWATGEKLTSTEMNAMDTNAAKALDKTSAGDTLSGIITVDATGKVLLDTGGTITVDDGSTFETSPLATVEVNLGAGGVVNVQSGGQIVTAGTGIIKWNNTDWPKLNSRSRSISKLARDLNIGDPNLFPTDWVASTAGYLSGTASSEPLMLRIPTHEGARLTGLSVYMKAAAHAGVPATLPRIEFFKRTKYGAVSVTETHYYPTPILANWNNVNITDWTIALSTPQVIDTSTYDYYVDLYDETGASSTSGNRYYSLSFAYDSITDMRFA